MRIIHIDLSGTFTEGMCYQENILPSINVQDGHEVYFIATNYIWKNGKIEEVPTGKYLTTDGFYLIRMSYQNLIFPILTKKLRMVLGLKKLLVLLEPDIIMLHCYQTSAVWPITQYLYKNTNVRLIVDCHADEYNSAQNIISKVVLNGLIYTKMAKQVLKYTDKIWCISYDTMKFAEKINNVPKQRLKYYPLGGKVFSHEEYVQKRKKIRGIHGLTANDIVLVHSGKLCKAKKTDALLHAMKKIKDERLKLIIIGSMDKEIKDIYESLTKEDGRICYVGWKSGEELLEYLCSADIYIQPGTQSATMQFAACCRCALAVYPYESHKYLFGKSVFYISGILEIINLLENILQNPYLIQKKREESYTIAEKKLDYRKLAAQIYEK